jgi:RecJ-like exonuclease
MDFFEDLAKTHDFLKQVKGPLKVLSHLDADGLSSAAIVMSVLRSQSIPFSLSIIPTLEEESIKRHVAPEQSVLFLDLGSGQLKMLNKVLKGRNVCILDHHEIEDETDFYHVNPRAYGMDGDLEISGAGVAYQWAKSFGKADHLAHLAIVGAIGDVQEDHGFKGINKKILAEAIEAGIVEQVETIRWFGHQNKKLVNLLAYGDVRIPGIIKNMSAAEGFLTDLGINAKIGDKDVMLFNLTKQEQKRLSDAIIKRREKLEDADDIFWNAYLLTKEQDGTLTRDIRELSTLLNACGRLSKPSVGLGLLLNDHKCKELAQVVNTAYKNRIVSAIRWYKDNKDNTDAIIKRDNAIIIKAQDNVMATMIGTLASIVANEEEEGTYIVSMAHAEAETTKVSIRTAGEGEPLNDIARAIVEKVGGQAGGHAMAAGAVIPRDVEDDFVKAALETIPVLVKQSNT